MPTGDSERELRQVAESLVLADMTFRKGKIAEAESMYERSLAMLIRTYAEAHPDVDACLLRLGDIYFAREKFAQALSTYSRLHGLRSRTLSIHHMDTIAISFKIAKTEEKLDRIDEAAKTYEEAIALGEQWLQVGHPLVGSMMESYAILLRKGKNDPQRAAEVEQKAKEYRKKYSGAKSTSQRLSALSASSITPFASDDVNEFMPAANVRDESALDTDFEEERPQSKNPLMIAFVVLVALIVPTFIGWTIMHQRNRAETGQQAAQPASFGATISQPASIGATIAPGSPLSRIAPIGAVTSPGSHLEKMLGSKKVDPEQIQTSHQVAQEHSPASNKVPSTPTSAVPLVRPAIIRPGNLPSEPASAAKPLLRHAVDKPVAHVKPKVAKPAPPPVSGVWSDIYKTREKYTH
jgi:hypothetical protein